MTRPSLSQVRRRGPAARGDPDAARRQGPLPAGRRRPQCLLAALPLDAVGDLPPRARAGVSTWLLRYRHRGWNGGDGPVEDARWALAEVRRELGELPVVLLGHSMGARTSVHAADHDSVVGVIGLAPWFPAGERVGGLAGRHLLAAHGRHDRITSYRCDRRVRRARPRRGLLRRAARHGSGGPLHAPARAVVERRGRLGRAGDAARLRPPSNLQGWRGQVLCRNRHRLGTAIADLEGDHHVVVLVDRVVAVHHVLALLGTELRDDPNGLALPEVHRVLAADLVGEREADRSCPGS